MNLPSETLALAPALLGCILRMETPDGSMEGVITETEAYTRDDPASHSFRGPTRRNASMFLPPFRAYVYRSYGIHHCLNVSSGPEGTGEAVLIRSLSPRCGIGLMRRNRPGVPGSRLTSGPGNLCAALGIDGNLDGHDLSAPPLRLVVPRNHRPPESVRTPRVGISRGAELPWRFVLVSAEPFTARKG
jgi:DNA-3-methyladenine glycosylase